MFEANNNHGANRLPSIIVSRLVMFVALILVVAGCGAGGTADNPNQATGSNDGSSGKIKTVSQSTSEDTPKTEQASGGTGDLGPPALGDPGAPVVMVEYADYQ